MEQQQDDLVSNCSNLSEGIFYDELETKIKLERLTNEKGERDIQDRLISWEFMKNLGLTSAFKVEKGENEIMLFRLKGEKLFDSNQAYTMEQLTDFKKQIQSIRDKLERLGFRH